MIVTIHQPNFMPWLGFFHKAAQADLFVLLDNVQFTKNGLQNRNRIKTKQGERWLTVPVLTKGRAFQPTNAVPINRAEKWADKHLRTIIESYARAPYLKKYLPALEETYHRDYVYLVDLNEALLQLFASWLGVGTPMIKASELEAQGESTQLLVSICQIVGANVYLSGPSGRSYLDEHAFREAGIELKYHHFQHPIYPQLHGDFMPNLSALDLLLNLGEKGAHVLADGCCG